MVLLQLEKSRRKKNLVFTFFFFLTILGVESSILVTNLRFLFEFDEIYSPVSEIVKIGGYKRFNWQHKTN